MTDSPVTAREALRMVRDLISAREARRTVVLVVCMVVTGVTEVVGIAGLLPLVSVVTQPTIVQTNRWLSWLYGGLGFQSVQSFIIFLGALFLTLYVLTYACSAFTYWLCLRFSVRMSDRLSTALLASYLQRPYAWLIGHNTTDLTRSVLDDTDKLVERFILRGATMLTKAVSALSICAALLWINPLVAITTSAVLSSHVHAHLPLFRTARRRPRQGAQRRQCPALQGRRRVPRRGEGSALPAWPAALRGRFPQAAPALQRTARQTTHDRGYPRYFTERWRSPPLSACCCSWSLPSELDSRAPFR